MQTFPQVVAIGIYDSRSTVKNREVTANRKTKMFEIELPIEENGTSYIDGEDRKICKDMLICAKPGQTRHTRLPFRCYYVHMICHDELLCRNLGALPNFLSTNQRDTYLHLFSRLCELYDSPVDTDRIQMHSVLLELICLLCREAESQTRSLQIRYKTHATIEQAISYIQTHLEADLSLSAVSAHLSFSPIHFHNSFKSATGKTLREYVEELRIKKAANLLLTTKLSLADIASECGFSSQSYFSCVFKRRLGITPREYVRNIHTRYENSGN